MMSRTSGYGLLKVRSAESSNVCLSQVHFPSSLFDLYAETLSNDHHATIQNGRIRPKGRRGVFDDEIAIQRRLVGLQHRQQGLH